MNGFTADGFSAPERGRCCLCVSGVVERDVELGVVIERVGPIPDEASNRGEHSAEHRMGSVSLHLELVAACDARRHLFTPEQEHAGWEKLLEDIQVSSAV